jgi:transposase
MTKHKTEDYKNSAVKYYFNNENGDGYKRTCKIFDCKKSTIRDWIKRYKKTKNLTRKNRKSISYKISKPQVNAALELLKHNEQLTMNELAFDMKQKYKNLVITPQHLGQIVRDNNKTRKRTRHEHFPNERYKKPIDKQTELDKFYSKVKQFPINKIICLDETSVGSALKPTYSRCNLGRRCIIKTTSQFVFRKFTLLVAISNSKWVGKEMYEKGGMTKERLLVFLEKHIFPKYRNYLIILDNAGSHNNELIKNAIIKSGNDYLFCIPYTPKTDAIEEYFNQIKTYLKKNRNVENYQQLEKNVDKAIEKVKPENYKNYFHHAYGINEKIYIKIKPSTRRRKLKNYKLYT